MKHPMQPYTRSVTVRLGQQLSAAGSATESPAAAAPCCAEPVLRAELIPWLAAAAFPRADATTELICTLTCTATAGQAWHSTLIRASGENASAQRRSQLHLLKCGLLLFFPTDAELIGHLSPVTFSF